MNRNNLFIELQKYINEVESILLGKNISKENVKLDHICYKCSENIEFENLRSEFEFCEKFIYQSIISKRRIAIVGFAQPFPSAFGNVNYLELSDQKPDGSQKSVVDHIELVPNGISYEEMVKIFSDAGFETIPNNLPHHKTYDIVLGKNIKIKLSHGILIDKIYKEEMI